MNALDAITAEHGEAADLARELAATSSRDPVERERLLGRLKVQVEAVNRAEESHLYPLLIADSETHDDALESRADNWETARLIRELEDAPNTSLAFQRAAELLADHLRDHARRERDRVLPRAGRAIAAERLRDVARRFVDDRARTARALASRQQPAERRAGLRAATPSDLA